MIEKFTVGIIKLLSTQKQILFLISKTDKIEVSEIMSIYKARNCSEQYIRNIFSNLKKLNYISSKSRGFYECTELGHYFIKKFNSKSNLLSANWDETWSLVFFNFTNEYRVERLNFKGYIESLGYGMFYDSIYISPWNQTKEIEYYIKAQGISDFVTSMHSCVINDVFKIKTPCDIWKLDHVSCLYLEKLANIKYIDISTVKILANTNEEISLFFHFLDIGDIISSLGLIDPMLPKKLLPSNWAHSDKFINLISYFNSLKLAFPKNSNYLKFFN